MAHTQFDPTKYPPAVATLLADDRLPELGPGTPNEDARHLLAALQPADISPRANNPEMVQACLSGLWLWHDFLDESHRISQDWETPTGSFWHAIMHRREPDASNSKYWWRRVGDHPVLDQLKERSPELGYFFTSPYDFVDLCEKVRDAGNAHEVLAKSVQLLEWRLLFDWCFEQATKID